MNTRRVFLILLLLLFLIPCVSATWDNDSYNYRIPVQINNTGCNTALEYYQVYFNITYDVDMESDFKDLIFYNNSDNTIIPHWNMTIVNNEYLEGYFNATYLDASNWTNNTIYLYFNNPLATSISDGDATFLFFDDFETWTGDVDWWNSDSFPKWDDVSVDGGLHCVYTGGHDGTYLMMLRPRNLAPTSSYGVARSKTTSIGGGKIEFWLKNDNLAARSWVRLLNASDVELTSWDLSESTTWAFNSLDISAYSGQAVKIQLEGWTSTCGMGFYSDYDTIRVRNYVSPEPDVVFGVKEEKPPPDATNLTATVTNDYIKFIWQEGIGNITTSYNVSINGTWFNETIETFIQISTTNNTTYNITIWAFNNGGNGILSNNPLSLIESIKIFKEVPTDYSIIQSLSILLIFLCIISLKTGSHLLSFCTTIISWYLAFNFTEIPLLAIFFAIIGLVYLLNPLLWLGEK